MDSVPSLLGSCGAAASVKKKAKAKPSRVINNPFAGLEDSSSGSDSDGGDDEMEPVAAPAPAPVVSASAPPAVEKRQLESGEAGGEAPDAKRSKQDGNAEKAPKTRFVFKGGVVGETVRHAQGRDAEIAGIEKGEVVKVEYRVYLAKKIQEAVLDKGGVVASAVGGSSSSSSSASCAGAIAADKNVPKIDPNVFIQQVKSKLVELAQKSLRKSGALGADGTVTAPAPALPDNDAKAKAGDNKDQNQKDQNQKEHSTRALLT